MHDIQPRLPPFALANERLGLADPRGQFDLRYSGRSAGRTQMRDRDGIYGDAFRKRIAGLGIEEVVSAPRSPWQNPYVERLIGSIRRECLNHVIVLGENHLQRILVAYFDYYNHCRTHLALDGNAPLPRQVEPPPLGKVRAIPHVGGLHHRYTRAAA